MADKKKDDGGQAFPCELYGGMTLRDYFAAKAMAAQIASSGVADLMRPEFCVAAYKWADAMLAERAK